MARQAVCLSHGVAWIDDGDLAVGARVKVRGGTWTIAERTAYDDCLSLRLSGADDDNAGSARTILVPFDRPVADARATSIQVLRPRRWLRMLRALAIEARPFGALSGSLSSVIDLLPYQLEPALAVIRHSAARVLIADGVGMGKTIQAGLVLNELVARRASTRALILLPAGLREQWSAELATRFGLRAIGADSSWLAGMGRTLPADVNPWSLPGIYVASLDFIKQPEVLGPVEETIWDLVVVDEAHQAAPGTARHAAVHALAAQARRVVLLTATPHSGDPAQFEALCRIGSTTAGESRMIVFRRSRSHAGLERVRQSVLMPVRLSDVERRMHGLLADYTGRLCREAGTRGNARARLVGIVLRKRALSSAASLAASCRRRIALLMADAAPDEQQCPLPFGDEDPLGDREPDGILGVPGLADVSRERRWLSAVAQAAELAARRESKLRVLIRFLSRLREPAVVFTEYRDTLERLRRALAPSHPGVAVLHGAMPPAERSSVQRVFNDRGTLLLATDAAAEGLNLHQRCRVVVHFELPWSPVRLEQRTGRVDRFGQRRRVHEIVLIAADTAERTVLAPLARRAAIARSSPAGRSPLIDRLTESRVAAAVMEGIRLGEEEEEGEGEEEKEEEPDVDRATQVLHDEAVEEAARLETLRRWRTHRAHRPSRPESVAASVVRLRGGHLPPGIVCVFTLSLHGGDGALAHSEIVATRTDGAVSEVPRHAGGVRRFVEKFVQTRAATLDEAVRRHLEVRSTGAAERILDAIDQLERRERDVAATLSRAPSGPIQAGLFDRRALLAGAVRTRARSAQREETRRVIEGLAAARQLSARLDLQAVLIASGPAAR